MPPSSDLKLKAVAAAVALTGGAPAALAVPVTVSQTLSLGALLDSGGSLSGAFDIAALAAGAGIVSGNVTVLSGQVIGYGYSDIYYSSNSNQGTYYDGTTYYSYGYTYWAVGGYYSYSCGFFGWSTCYAAYYVPVYVSQEDRNFYNSNYYLHEGAGATMQLSVDGQSGTDTTDQSYSNVTYGGYLHTNTFWNGSGYDYVYDRQVDQYVAWYGPLTVSIFLNQTQLDDLGTADLLPFTFASLDGRFNVNSVNFQATFDVPGDSSAPAPGTLALVSGGILGLLALRRRKVNWGD